MLKTLSALRYLQPLREGGSLPAIVEADDQNLYVMKFVGAGQGPKALIAEVLAGEIGRHLGLQIPELVLLELDPALGRSEPDPEIQDLLKASAGLNLGMRFLPEALDFNVLLSPPPAPELASDIVWFDAYITNVDRTARNVNLLIWREALWLIDHGAAFYFHHAWDDYQTRSRNRFPLIRDHTLISFASQLAKADARLRQRLSPALLTDVVNLIPVTWLNGDAPFVDADRHRAAYVDYLLRRLEASALFVEEAISAHQKFI